MDTTSVLSLVQESVYVITVFLVFLIYAMAKGRYAVITVIFSLYFALLITLTFPYFNETTGGDALAKILIFLGFVVASMILLRKHIPGDDYENAFQSFWKKVLVALMATVLVMLFSIHALPVTEIIDPGTPMQELFGPQENFFWWLVVPLIALFFV